VTDKRHPSTEAMLELRRRQEALGLRRPHVRIADIMRPFAVFVYVAIHVVALLIVLSPLFVLMYLYR